MSKELPSNQIPPEDNLKVKVDGKFNPDGWSVFRTIDIPKDFSSGAIKELLSQMVWGYNPDRAVSYVPNDGETDDAVVLTANDFVRMRSLSRADRLCELDIHAMRIKASENAVIVERM